jgi:signal transduction histidine kinase
MGALVRAALDLTSERDVDQILERMVQSAAAVAGARYAALAVYDSAGRIERFVHHGVDRETAARIGAPPQGRGLLGEVILADRPIRIDDISADPRSCGVPPHHPPMRTFLGVPVRLGRKRFGNLYLTDRRDGHPFDVEDEELVVTLATFAAAAIEGAQLVTVERELARMQERARARRDMLALVIRAQEAERARVARDLHDEIGQALTSVLLGLRLVTDSLETGPDLTDARAHTAEVRDLVTAALDRVRSLAFDLRPTVLDDVGLVPALRRLVDDVQHHFGIPATLALDGIVDDTRLAPELETVVYRVVQEALTNVGRHARAAGATVSLSVGADALHAVISDDGIGFAVPTGDPRSLGIAGMAERAALVGGAVQISSAPRQGTRVELEVPLA